jgi:hypothetical protein
MDLDMEANQHFIDCARWVQYQHHRQYDNSIECTCGAASFYESRETN